MAYNIYIYIVVSWLDRPIRRLAEFLNEFRMGIGSKKPPARAVICVKMGTVGGDVGFNNRSL